MTRLTCGQARDLGTPLAPLLPAFCARFSLKIGKIPTILRREASDFACESRVPSMRGLDHVAIGTTRHDAILQLAGGGEVVREPQSDRQQDDDDQQSRHCGMPVVAGSRAWARFRFSHRQSVAFVPRSAQIGTFARREPAVPAQPQIRPRTQVAGAPSAIPANPRELNHSAGDFLMPSLRRKGVESRRATLYTSAQLPARLPGCDARDNDCKPQKTESETRPDR